MKRPKEQKEHIPMSKGKKIALCLVIGFLAAVGVFVALFFVNRISGYREAKNYTDEILGTKAAVLAYVEREVKSEELSDEDKQIFENFRTAMERAESYTKSLGASRALKDKKVSEKYRIIKERVAELGAYKSVEEKLLEVLGDGKISEEELKIFSESGNDFLRKVAGDLEEYYQKVEDFTEKYASVDSANKAELDNDYAAIINAGQELAKKYREIKTDNVCKMSRDDILSFYATIEELNKYLSEKI